MKFYFIRHANNDLRTENTTYDIRRQLTMKTRDSQTYHANTSSFTDQWALAHHNANLLGHRHDLQPAPLLARRVIIVISWS